MSKQKESTTTSSRHLETIRYRWETWPTGRQNSCTIGDTSCSTIYCHATQSRWNNTASVSCQTTLLARQWRGSWILSPSLHLHSNIQTFLWLHQTLWSRHRVHRWHNWSTLVISGWYVVQVVHAQPVIWRTMSQIHHVFTSSFIYDNLDCWSYSHVIDHTTNRPFSSAIARMANSSSRSR